MARDHRVRIKAREDIAKIAMSWWNAATKRGNSFNICEFVVETLTKRFTNKGRLRIEFYERGTADEPAFVTFRPLVLHVDRKIWNAAGLGDTYARFVVAHEIGHIVLHDEFAVAFSDDEAAQLGYLDDEESGEWQANIFAGHFLAPDHVVLKLCDTDLIAGLCVISDDLAVKRYTEAKNAKKVLHQKYDGDMCAECSNFTLVRSGYKTTCDTCGHNASSEQRFRLVGDDENSA
jgi:hypothetical protein